MLITETTRPDAQALSARIQGDAFGPADAGYDDARSGFVLAVDHRPAIVALPETADDVVTIVRFAKDHGLRVAPQATGHNAHPLGDLSGAILLKTSRMRGAEVDAERKVVRVEAGTWWIDVTSKTSPLGLAPLSGSSPDVGVVGYTLGGGASWLVRKHGLSANNVVAIEVVTADGELVRADHEHHADLFWALRGGGGSFGVVTAMELRLFDHAEVYGGVMFWPIERAAEVLKTWRAMTRTVSDDVTSIGRLLNVPPIDEVPEFLRGKSFVTVEVVFTGDEAEGAELVRPLRELGPQMDTFKMMTPVELSHLHMDPEGPVPAAEADTMMLGAGLDDDAIDAFVAAFTAGPSPVVMYELRHIGGAAGRSGADHGALDALPGEYLAFGGGMPFDDGMKAALHARLGRVRDALAAHDTQRTYLNFQEQPVSAAEFFGAETYTRLRAVRAAVDPGRLFVANHPID